MKLSENFRLGEFACKGGSCCENTAAIAPGLVHILQKARTELGQPIRVNSGFRCVKHNRAVGGVTNSYHTMGWAADLVPLGGVELGELYRVLDKVLAEERVLGGLIMYRDRGFVHVDIRSNMQYRRA